MLKRMQWMLTLRLNTFLSHLVNLTHTGVLDRRLTFTHSHKFSQLNVLGPSTSTFFNLAISNINPAGYWKIYPVPVLVEHAHVKEREHEKHVVQTAKIREVPKSWYIITAACMRSTRVYEYRGVQVPAPCAGCQ